MQQQLLGLAMEENGSDPSQTLLVCAWHSSRYTAVMSEVISFFVFYSTATRRRLGSLLVCAFRLVSVYISLMLFDNAFSGSLSLYPSFPSLASSLSQHFSTSLFALPEVCALHVYFPDAFVWAEKASITKILIQKPVSAKYFYSQYGSRHEKMIANTIYTISSCLMWIVRCTVGYS
jgi:hypothetical protein